MVDVLDVDVVVVLVAVVEVSVDVVNVVVVLAGLDVVVAFVSTQTPQRAGQSALIVVETLHVSCTTLAPFACVDLHMLASGTPLHDRHTESSANGQPRSEHKSEKGWHFKSEVALVQKPLSMPGNLLMQL